MNDDNEMFDFDETQYLNKLYEDDTEEDIFDSQTVVFLNDFDENTYTQKEEIEEAVPASSISEEIEEVASAGSTSEELEIHNPTDIDIETIQTTNNTPHKIRGFQTPHKIRGFQKK